MLRNSLKKRVFDGVGHRRSRRTLDRRLLPGAPGRFRTTNGSEFNNKMFVMAYMLGEWIFSSLILKLHGARRESVCGRIGYFRREAFWER